MTDEEMAKAVEQAIAPADYCPKCQQMVVRPHSDDRLTACEIVISPLDGFGPGFGNMNVKHTWYRQKGWLTTFTERTR